MIIQEFYWNDYKILTLCHENMENGIKDRIMEESFIISDSIISFKEFCIEENIFDNFEWDFIIEGFLDCNHNKNPYSEYSVFYKEFVNSTNNNLVEDNSFKISHSNFIKLYEFIKEFSNFSITSSVIGNMLFFSPIKISVESNNSENFPYLTILGEDTKGTAIVKFKLNDIILESAIFENISDGDKIYSHGDWNNYEIEIYDECRLIYKAKYNIIRSIRVNVKSVSSTTEKKLIGYDKKIKITKVLDDQCIIGDDSQLDSISSYLNIESNYSKQNIISKEISCNFLRKNEIEKAFSIFERLMELPGEIWIFDPYAISDDNWGISGLINIIMILCETKNTKNIVFCETNGITFDYFKEKLTNNAQDYFKGLNLKNLNFIKAKESFHDRFIFSKTKDSIIGYQWVHL